MSEDWTDAQRIEQAAALAKDIANGEAHAGWSADWYMQLALGFQALERRSRDLEGWLRFYTDDDVDVDYMLRGLDNRRVIDPDGNTDFDWKPPEIC